MQEKLKKILTILQSAPEILAGKKIAAGFDGFVDSIVRVVNNKAEDGSVEYFNTIKGFGDYISGKSGSGFSLESDELFQKLGGNMPIMANALAETGAKVDCIGAFGLPGLHAAFTEMHENCRLISFTNPGFTTAMEFTDGKIMLAQMTDLNNADWGTIKNAVGLPKLREIFSRADLVCLVNWSEPTHSNKIWLGLLTDIFAGEKNKPAKSFFFDLSDCSKRSSESVKEALELINKFGNYGHVTLSLNRNEAGILYRILAGGLIPDDLQTVGDRLIEITRVQTLVIHTSKISLAWDAAGSYCSEPLFIPNPIISTGAGDNFNSGFCIAQVLGMDTEQALILANSSSNCYIKSGKSPSQSILTNHISEIISSSL